MTNRAFAEVLTEKRRISAIDITRGLVMLIMALDHTRDFYHADAFLYNPTDLEKTTPIVFLTRFVTHFCAPTFVLLAGVSVRLSEERKTKKALSLFLLTRGLWLIFLEMTVIRFGLLFQFYYDMTMFQVIWAIGISMVLLSAIIHFPFKVVLVMGILITFFHDLLHAISLQPGDPFVLAWSLIHQFNFLEVLPGRFALTAYPFLPWFGIMILGYCMGECYRQDHDPELRQKFLLRTGISAFVLFLILRSLNFYGDPAPWSQQSNAVYTLMSFINVTKYPVSLLYTLLTLGPVLIFLSLLEKSNTRPLHPLAVVGRVPLFYYILHFFLIHGGAIVLYMIHTGKRLSEIDFHFNASFGGIPPGYGYSLIWVYVAWATVVAILYPLCRWYYQYKSTHKQAWLRYL